MIERQNFENFKFTTRRWTHSAKIFCTEIISRKLRKQIENSANGIKFERKNYKNDKMSKCEKSWKSKDEKTKIENMSKNVFDEILKQNYFLKTKFELSGPSSTPKH